MTTSEIPMATVDTTKIETASTTALAHSAGRRRGTAARVERIIPVEYSPVMTSTPSTTTAREAMLAAMENTSMLTGAPRSFPCEASIAENRVTIATITITVAARVQIVERRVRNLIHSEFTTRTKVSCTSPAGGLASGDGSVGEIRTVVLIGPRLPCWTARGLRRGGRGACRLSSSGTPPSPA